jgi:hypothetical protein
MVVTHATAGAENGETALAIPAEVVARTLNRYTWSGTRPRTTIQFAGAVA